MDTQRNSLRCFRSDSTSSSIDYRKRIDTIGAEHLHRAEDRAGSISAWLQIGITAGAVLGAVVGLVAGRLVTNRWRDPGQSVESRLGR